MTTPTITQHEWAHLAWAMGAREVGVDIEQLDLEWAERVFGDQARQFIANHDALMTLRFGPAPRRRRRPGPRDQSPRQPTSSPGQFRPCCWTQSWSRTSTSGTSN